MTIPTATASAPAPVTDVFARMASIRARFEVTDRGTVTNGTISGSPQADDFSQTLRAVESTMTGSVLPASGSVDSAQVLDVAREYLGIPYLWGGTDPSVGLDCSGFVQHVYARFGIDLPRVSRDQARAGEPVASIEAARPGDLIAFGEPVDHISIYMGDGKIIHAPQTGDVVKISDVYREPTAIRRVIPESKPTSLLAGLASGATIGAMPGTGSGSSTAGVERYRSLFEAAGSTYGLSPELLAAVASVESGGNAQAVSSAGARGLMQFMPATAKAMGIDPMVPSQAVDGAARYLSDQLRTFGSLELALAAYNAGPGAVRRFGGVPPYSETQGYIRKVTERLGGSL